MSQRVVDLIETIAKQDREILRLRYQVLPKPISEMPDEFKDGRKVLVFGEYRYEDFDVHTGWIVAEFEGLAWSSTTDATFYYAITPTHFLPYPAEPK